MANKSKVLVSLFATVFLVVLFFLAADKAEAAVTPGYYSPLVVLVIISNVKQAILTTKRTCNLVSAKLIGILLQLILESQELYGTALKMRCFYGQKTTKTSIFSNQ